MSNFFTLFRRHTKQSKKKINVPQKSSLHANRDIKSFTYPKLHTGKDWYIDFYAFDPVSGNMKRKKFKLNHIEKIGDRRRYADGLIKRIIQKLDQGWNPWVESLDGIQ